MLRPWELQIKINHECTRAVYVQIADGIRLAIQNGQLPIGTALPGSRSLAKQFNLNRNTVVRALEVLFLEGWLKAEERKGAFVSMPEVQNDFETVKPKVHLTFDDGVPDSRLAPMDELARAYKQIFSRKSKWQLMGYASELGDVDFRDAIVHMLNFKRGMRVANDQICITRGSQMAMYLTAQVLINKGDYVMVENPGYQPAWRSLEHAGAVLLPVSVDDEGLSTVEVANYLQQYKNIKAIYTTPHHQFPTTVTLSPKRRTALVELANQYQFTIIEDDYDHEFHFGKEPIFPLAGIPHLQNYVYIGTMSKIVAPALRIGYVVGSESFIRQAGALRKIIDVQGDNIMEQAVLQLINDGEIKRHLKKAAMHYLAKRDFFAKLIQQHLKDKVTFQQPEGGLAFWIVPNKTIDISTFLTKLLKKGIQLIDPKEFSFDAKTAAGFRIGYASLTEKQLEEGVIAIAKLI